MWEVSYCGLYSKKVLSNLQEESWCYCNKILISLYYNKCVPFCHRAWAFWLRGKKWNLRRLVQWWPTNVYDGPFTMLSSSSWHETDIILTFCYKGAYCLVWLWLIFNGQLRKDKYENFYCDCVKEFHTLFRWNWENDMSTYYARLLWQLDMSVHEKSCTTKLQALGCLEWYALSLAMGCLVARKWAEVRK